MMKRILAGLVLILLTSQADAIMLTKGVREFSVSGYLNRTSDINLSLTTQYGRFIRDYVQVGPIGAINWVEGGDVIRINGGVFGEIHRPLHDRPLLFPYYGATASLFHTDFDGYLNESSSTTGIEVSGYYGWKYFMLDNMAVGADFEFKLATDRIYVGNKRMEFFDWVINLSTRFYF